ncbi:MAG TPA: HdeD family acid-resistance protein [Casimicrobiaceae bacterium]|jgi:uncharacterized membrane protein HdeD (DUF308 family)
MKDVLTRSWWLLALRGVVAILFGVLALIMPGLTLLWLVALFAAFAIIAGISSAIGASRARGREGWGVMLLVGIVFVIAGVLAIIYPGLTALTLILLIGANALVTGVLDIVAAIRLRRQIEHEWLLVAEGVVSIVFGAVVLIFPGAGALALVWFVSLYALLSGILLLMVAMRARRWRREDGFEATPAPAPR